MRDKVKRFISILMTALMLVNLLPVGALAEGFTISNSVQSRGYQKPSANVYVYVKVTGDKAGLTINPSGWYTIGKSTNVPGMGIPSSVGPRSFRQVGVWPDTVLDKSRFTRHADNQKIDLDKITWTEFYIDNGADNYVNAGTYTWHMNGTIDIKQLPSVYTIKYVDYDTKELIHSYEKTGLMGQKPEKITAPDSWQENLYSFYFVNGHPKEQTVDFTKDKGELTFYYKKNTAAYTVNYYLNGTETKVADSINKTAPLGSIVNPPTEVTGYTLVPEQKTSLTIVDGDNVLNLYYYKNVELTANSDTVPYNGQEQEVSGFTGAPKGSDFSAINVSATGTDVGTYTAAFADGTVGTVDATGKYIVTKATDGQLVITPKAIKVTVTGNTDTKVYNGKLQSVVDFTTDAPEGVTVRLKTGKEAKAEGQNVGTYPMGLTEEDFEVESQNYAVELSVNDGWLEITPKAIKVTVTGNTDTKVYTGETQSVVDFTTDEPEGVTVRLKSGKEAKAEGQNVGTYYMGLTEEDFEVESQNYKVELSVTDGWLEITPVTDKVTVTVTEKSGTATYDGKEHIVSGYESMTADNELYDVDASVQETPTAAWTVKGKDAGEYPVGIAADDFKNINTNFENVEFVVVDGALEITPAPVTLQAPIASKTYDGEPLKAEDYVHSYVEGVNFADDFAAVILTGSQTLVGSSSSLITEVIPKEGKKLKNYKFTFLPGTLTVTDGTGDDPVKPENVVTKTHTPKDTGYNVGETVTFTISVKNIYNTPKTITLTEKENVKFSNGESVIVFNDVPAGETVTAEATYTITSADILEGVFHNTVTADFTGGGSWTAEDTVTTAELDTTLNVTKTSDVPDGQKAALGQKITYTIKVQNAGNVPYTNVKVEDPLTGLTETIETLPVGETKTFTTEYVVTEADVLKGSVLNTATATGDKIKDPASDEKQKEPNGGDEVETPTFAPITIKPKDVTATYNGASITGKDVEITSGKLLEGHKLSAAVIGSGVNAGSYELTLDPEKIKIVDANNKDVSEMYARTILPGKLIINKRSVLITSQSATKTYDGSALTRPAVTITGDGFVPGELAKAEATGSITNVGSTPNAIQYTTTGAFNAANYSIALSVGTLTVTEKPKPEPRRTFNLTINYVYQNGKRAAASYNRGGLKNGETFDITSPVIAGYTASETVVSGTIYNRDIKVTVIYTADGVNLDDYGVPLGLGNITMNVGDCFE